MSTKKCMSASRECSSGAAARASRWGDLETSILFSPERELFLTKNLFVGRLSGLRKSRVLVETEIHKLRCIALADGRRSIRLLDFFKFEINFSIMMDRAQQVTIDLG